MFYYVIMPKTIDDLVTCCMLDSRPPMPVFVDYFGLDNIDNLSIILGLYQGMIKIKGMNKTIIENIKTEQKTMKTNQTKKDKKQKKPKTKQEDHIM